jgi:hypothetical protein
MRFSQRPAVLPLAKMKCPLFSQVSAWHMDFDWHSGNVEEEAAGNVCAMDVLNLYNDVEGAYHRRKPEACLSPQRTVAGVKASVWGAGGGGWVGRLFVLS